MKPWQTFLFALCFFLVLGFLGYFTPQAGFPFYAGHRLRIPDPKALFKHERKTPDIKKIITAIEEGEPGSQLNESPAGGDSAFRIEGGPKTLKGVQRRDSSLRLITHIQKKNPKALNSIFEALYRLQNGQPDLVRILHYGDSQIEGDRITDFFRQKLQSEFGGSGPGFMSLVPLTSSIINKLETSGNWERYNTATSRDNRVPHPNFGMMAGFTRFTPYRRIYDTTKAVAASLLIKTNPVASASARAYTRLRLYYGGAKRKTWCEFYDGPALMSADSLEAWGMMKFRDFIVTPGSYSHRFKFRSKDSPDFYGISLEGTTGVMVDNIPLRGSSGTFFHLVSNDQMRQFYDHLNVRLIILQFGGNTLPAIKSDTMARNYASYIRGQISIVKKLAPGASILFIGPADMDVKEGTDYVTHPYLEILRDELKKAVLDAGCAFYDLYDIMGGANSMAAWVEENLAAPDYIHFSPRGARKVSALLHAAFIEEYYEFLKTKELH